MKKVAYLLFAFAVTFALTLGPVGCGGGTKAPTPKDPKAVVPDPKDVKKPDDIKKPDDVKKPDEKK